MGSQITMLKLILQITVFKLRGWTALTNNYMLKLRGWSGLTNNYVKLRGWSGLTDKHR